MNLLLQHSGRSAIMVAGIVPLSELLFGLLLWLLFALFCNIMSVFGDDVTLFVCCYCC